MAYSHSPVPRSFLEKLLNSNMQPAGTVEADIGVIRGKHLLPAHLCRLWLDATSKRRYISRVLLSQASIFWAMYARLVWGKLGA